MRKKIAKSILAMTMIATMLFGLTACGGKEEPTANAPAAESSTEEAAETNTEKEPVTLEWYYVGNGMQEDTEAVEARVNELLKEYPGLEHVTLNLNCFIGDEIKEKIALAEAAGEQIDIMNCMYVGFADKVAEGSYMPMNDLISDEFKAALPDWLWDLGSVDGNIYMVPTYQQACNLGYMFTPTEYMEKYGDYDKMVEVMSSADSTPRDIANVMEEYLLAIREGEGDTKYLESLADRIVNAQGSQGFYFCDPFDHLTSYFVIEEGTDTVNYRFTTDLAKECYQISAEWYDKGYIYPDILTAEVSELRFGSMLNPTSWVMSARGAIGDPEYAAAGQTTEYGFDATAIPCQPYYYIQNSWAANGNGIHATCEHPEEAALLLEAVNTGTEKGKEIYNTLVFGLEGEHYTVDANDPERIETIEYAGSQGGLETSYAAWKWIIGNTIHAWKNQAVTDELNGVVLEVNEGENTVASKYAGFVPDVSSVSSQIEQINAVRSEYVKTLCQGVLGTDGWEATYDEFVTKLEAAGLSEVQTELQRQLDEFLAK